MPPPRLSAEADIGLGQPDVCATRCQRFCASDAARESRLVLRRHLLQASESNTRRMRGAGYLFRAEASLVQGVRPRPRTNALGILPSSQRRRLFTLGSTSTSLYARAALALQSAWSMPQRCSRHHRVYAASLRPPATAWSGSVLYARATTRTDRAHGALAARTLDGSPVALRRPRRLAGGSSPTMPRL